MRSVPKSRTARAGVVAAGRAYAAGMDRAALGSFLRKRREALQPAEVGLVPGGRRRTPGLRRDEVALLANMSTDYYERLEQGRGPHPSTALLAGIARALRLTPDERDHLYVLAGQPPPPAFNAGGYVDPGLLCILDALAPTVPAFVADDIGQVLAQNPLSVSLLGAFHGETGRAANVLWRFFTDSGWRSRYPETEHEEMGRSYVADLRAAAARRGADPAVTGLIADLRKESAEFARLWERNDVAVLRSAVKTFARTRVGWLTLQCDIVVSPPSGQRLVMFRAAPGTDAAARLDMLRVLGSQHLEPITAGPYRPEP